MAGEADELVVHPSGEAETAGMECGEEPGEALHGMRASQTSSAGRRWWTHSAVLPLSRVPPGSGAGDAGQLGAAGKSPGVCGFTRGFAVTVGGNRACRWVFATCGFESSPTQTLLLRG